MLFAVGVFIGCVAGLVVALVFALPDRMFFAKQTVPIIIALIALVLGSVALVESTQSHDTNNTDSAASNIAAATTVPPTTPPTTTPPSTAAHDANGFIQVPNVLKLKETDALTILSQNGLQWSVDTLNLSNVPSGYVMSQSPLPGSNAPPGTTVSLQVSAGA